MQLRVHLLELRPDPKDYLHAFSFRHLVICKTGHAYVIYYFHTAKHQFTVYPVSLRGKSYRQGVGRIPAYLPCKIFHIRRKSRYFMIKTVNLCRVADDGPERIQILVELPLQVGRSLYFLFRPYMSGSLQHHHLLLVFQLFLRLVRVEQYHSGQNRIVLCLYLADTDARQQHNYQNRPFHRVILYRVREAARRQRDMAMRATSPLLRSSIPAVTFLHTSLKV